MKKLIIFNWKMNPQSFGEAKQLLNRDLRLTTNDKNAEIVICPPFIYLSASLSVVGRRSSVKLGAQDVFWLNRGAYTGEISPTMLKNLGVEYVIIGHSERRRILGETDEMINKKILAALKAGLKVILCVGEPTRAPARELRIKNAELRKAKNYVRRQLLKDLKGVLNLKSEILNLIVAYEPVWAIGAGKPCHPQDALEMTRFIKNALKTKSYKLKAKVLYGGSVNGKNIKNFIKLKEIDGALVGGASLQKEEVEKIINNIKDV